MLKGPDWATRVLVGGAILIFLGVIFAVSCQASGAQYYHIPGVDTHKSKTHKPQSRWSLPKTTGGFRKR